MPFCEGCAVVRRGGDTALYQRWLRPAIVLAVVCLLCVFVSSGALFDCHEAWLEFFYYCVVHRVVAFFDVGYEHVEAFVVSEVAYVV